MPHFAHKTFSQSVRGGLATYTGFQMSHFQLNAIATEESGRFSWDGLEKERVKRSVALDDKELSVLAFRGIGQRMVIETAFPIIPPHRISHDILGITTIFTKTVSVTKN